MKDEFIKIFKENIHREGADALLAWLEKSDFFTAPASSKYHANYEGGLCVHSVNVYKRLLVIFQTESANDPTAYAAYAEALAICALLHDLCKVNYYKKIWSNVKVYAEGGSRHDEGGDFDWHTVPGYAVEDKLPYGHGEKSVYMISGFMKLSRDEAMAIRWHMGATDNNGGDSAKAFRSYFLPLRLHIADLQATFIDEKESAPA